MSNKKQDRILIGILSSLSIIAMLILLLQLVSIHQEDALPVLPVAVVEIQAEDDIESVENSPVASNALSEEKSEEKTNAPKQATKEAKKRPTKTNRPQKENPKQAEKMMQSADGFAQERAETAQQMVEPEQLPKKNNQYTGLSSYTVFLYSRKIIKESPPIYKCQKGGKIIILIRVNRSGEVVQAQLSKENHLENSEKIDDCLKESAIESAYKTKFNEDSTAERLQNGKIIFIFTAQK
jgi:hypothetical protein